MRKRAASSLTVTEQLQDQHYRSYMGYLRCISIIQAVGSIIGVVWATQIFILNTGTYADSMKSKWYSDKNSLCTTIGVTFSWLSVLAFLQFVISIRIGLTRSRKRLGRVSQVQMNPKAQNSVFKEIMLQLCGASAADAED